MVDPNTRRNKLFAGRIAPAIMCCFALGNLLVAVAKGGLGLNNLFVPAVASALLLFGAGSMVLVTWQNHAGTVRYASFKIAVDAIAAAFVALFLLCPWWLYFYVTDYGDQRPAGGFAYLPLPLKVLMLDGPPFIAGLIWLLFRLTARQENGQPRLSSNKIGLIVAMTASLFLGAPLFLLKQIGK
ncbi:MAG TPA: hypothetical protein VN821_04900 [Candidatus Udaeobacter sp.]|nr:hypothetical protein [Candidatus Udaeobacter sp.]